MILVDVNPLIYAFRPGAPFHELSRSVLTQARHDRTLILLPEVAASFLRIVTDGRWQDAPDELVDSLDFIEQLGGRGTLIREPSPTRWRHFEGLARRLDLRGPQIPDGLVAGAALDFRAAVLTADRDFLSFPGVRVQLLTSAGLVDHVVSD